MDLRLQPTQNKVIIFVISLLKYRIRASFNNDSISLKGYGDARLRTKGKNQSQGGFPLSRNFYARTDVNFNWLNVRKLK